MKDNEPKQAVILCGGLGSRLRPYTNSIPKPMILCNDKPFLWYLMNQLSDEGINHFVLLTGYLGNKIQNYFGNGESWGWKINYSDGPTEWDTGKRIWEARKFYDDCFMLLYSDNFATFSLNKLFSAHKRSNKSLTFMVSKKTPGNVSLDDSGIVRNYDNNRVSSALEYVEIGYMIVENKKTLSFFESYDCSFSEILEKMSNEGQINSYIHEDAYYSISDPIRWKKTEKYLNNNKIILIDRDGVINKKSKRGEYVTNWLAFKWLPDTLNAMKLLAKEGFKFIVITNQAGIARGMIDSKELDKIHFNMKNEMARNGVEILDIYICTHHWEENCNCRKPKPGMLFQASKEWLFRLDKAFFIGDDPRDCKAAFNAGCKSMFIGNEKELEILSSEELPIYKFSNLSSGIQALIK